MIRMELASGILVKYLLYKKFVYKTSSYPMDKMIYSGQLQHRGYILTGNSADIFM